MDILKLIGIGLIGTILAGVLKGLKSEFSTYVILGTGIIILVNIISSMSGVVEVFSEIINKTKIDNDLFSGILKIVGIGYITEYSAGICADAGGESIASKILLGGKIMIFLTALPILNKLVDIVIGLLP